MLIHSSVSVLNILPACRQKFVEDACPTHKVQQAWLQCVHIYLCILLAWGNGKKLLSIHWWQAEWPPQDVGIVEQGKICALARNQILIYQIDIQPTV